MRDFGTSWTDYRSTLAQRVLFERSVAIADGDKAASDDTRGAKIVEAAAEKAEAQIAYEHLTHKSESRPKQLLSQITAQCPLSLITFAVC